MYYFALQASTHHDSQPTTLDPPLVRDLLDPRLIILCMGKNGVEINWEM